MNKRITPRERGLIKGGINRAFSRSELRNKVLDATRIEHSDPKRPRVKKWSRCPLCKQPCPTYLMAVDHIIPKIPLNSSFEEMSMDDYLDRTWCEEANLQAICDTCHDKKTALERDVRKNNKRAKKAKK